MVSVELTKEQIENLIALMEGSTVPIPQAEDAAEVYKKLKDSIK